MRNGNVNHKTQRDLTPAEALLAVGQGEDLVEESVLAPEAMADGSKELYEQVRARIVRPGGVFFLGKGIIGFPDLTERTHLALGLVYERDDMGHRLVEFPKSHLKTTLGTVTKVLHVFGKLAINGEDLWERIGIGSNTKTNAKRFLRLIRNVPEGNAIFQYFLPELLPEFSNEEVWNQDEIIFPRTGSYTDPSVDTLGIGGAATSRHYTGFIEDDMLDEETADSAAGTRTAIDLHKYNTSLMVPGNNGKFWFLTNEHSWTQFDLNAHIIKNEPDTMVFSVGASRGYNRQRSRLVPKYVERLTETWEDGEGVWPERFGRLELLRRRQTSGARVHNAVMENDPFDPDVVDFKEEWLRYYEWTHDGNIRIMPDSAKGIEMEVVPLKFLNVSSAYDPALSKKTTAARSAFTATGVDQTERVFLLEAWARRLDPKPYIEGVLERVLKWDIQQCAVEVVLFQKVLYDMLVDRCKAHNERDPENTVFPGVFKAVHPPKGKNKEARIRALIGTAFESGRVYIHKSMSDFIDEYLHFPIGETVDLLDAFAYTAELWAPGTSEQEIVDYTAAEQRYLAQRDAVTGY